MTAPPGVAHSAHHPAHHFEDFRQQNESATLGIWLFLLTEVLFIGALFAAYAVYRVQYPAAFIDGSRRLDLVLGAVNTTILIVSSWLVALSVHAASVGNRRRLVLLLAVTAALGAAFLGIKSVEYAHKIHDRLVPGPGFAWTGPEPEHVELFFVIYFITTGIHAAHVLVGVGCLIWVAIGASRGRFSPESHALVDGVGLYWHFVDIVWIFLFPLLYLLGRHP
jgi:cytochrome c oxidase subunit III